MVPGYYVRILHVIGTLNPEAGGPTESVRVLLTFGPLGYSGEVVTLDPPEAPYLAGLPFRVHALGPQSTRYGYNRRLVSWLLENRSRFDGVVVNGLWQFCGLATWLTLRGQVPYVVFAHGMLDPWFKRTFPTKHLKKLLYWYLAEYWILRDAHRVLFTSTEESRLAETSFPTYRWTGEIVPYGASRPPNDRMAAMSAFYAICPEVEKQRYLIYLGRIHRKKGCDHLVEAFCRLKSTEPSLHLVMAGPDQQQWASTLREVSIRCGMQDRIHWPGMLTGAAKWGSLLGAEAFILPSHQENFGIAVAEALSCGCPVLLSDKVNIAQQVFSDGAGLVADDTLAGTQQLLEGWLATPAEERVLMSRRARDCFENRYDMRKNAETIVRLFESAKVILRS